MLARSMNPQLRQYIVHASLTAAAAAGLQETLTMLHRVGPTTRQQQQLVFLTK
jgi:hypothetical protein